ncbi:Os01g0674400 [Oryza sativa Japonica Group]|uniref:Os01g0674400 protein n=1 Tax=Oryza sativa subsp. japonica TaxID=39947 RepID=C7IX22_ORYSJ|nr:Os01g0674400 [Oryza sativa Japonica Group]|eukprot:NP_001172501.1 Os01g0674400 [Oryza sativa Japonica Group]
MAMLGRKRGGSSSAKLPPHAEDPRAAPPPPQAGLTATDGGQEVAMSQFVAQLGMADEAARKRLDSMNQRLRWLEQQMETLEAEVGKASSAD